MSKASLILLFLFVVLILGGAAFLATWDIPAPTARVENVLPDERFEKVGAAPPCQSAAFSALLAFSC